MTNHLYGSRVQYELSHLLQEAFNGSWNTGAGNQDQANLLLSKGGSEQHIIRQTQRIFLKYLHKTDDICHLSYFSQKIQIILLVIEILPAVNVSSHIEYRTGDRWPTTNLRWKILRIRIAHDVKLGKLLLEID